MDTIIREKRQQQIENEKELADAPRPAISYKGHIKSLGGEMRSWVREGAITGALIGFVVGFGLYVSIYAGWVSIPLLDQLQLTSPFLFFLTVLFLSTVVGTGGGAVVGIGTPKVNPHPQQGWVAEWKTFLISSRQNQKDKEAYFPIMKRTAPRNK